MRRMRCYKDDVVVGGGDLSMYLEATVCTNSFHARICFLSLKSVKSLRMMACDKI